jgi:uncharacterized protein (TIGR03118 family)
MYCNAQTETIRSGTAAAMGSECRSYRRIATLAVAGLILGLGTVLAPEPAAAGYFVTNLVSDVPGLAPIVDPNLVNPWGLTRSDASPWWVSDNGTGVATLYQGNGTPRPLIVTIPPPAGGAPPSAPTGVVFNSNAASFGGARFIFSTEDGVIASWQNVPVGNTNAVRQIDNSASGAVYKGLAIVNNGGQNLIYATDFHNNKIDVFTTGAAPNSFVQAALPGKFTDPNLPAGYAPFGIQNIGGQLYVTYALREAGGDDDVPGAGHGFVDVFDTNGNLLQRFASDDTLNSPWGIALAPGDFGEFSNDLLIGNFGDGRISAFNLATSKLVGQLNLQIEGLWALQFGGGPNSSSGATSHLYFTAGIPGPGDIEDHGLFGFIAATGVVPEPASAVLLLSAIGLFSLCRRPFRRL